jgi:hypothetical protein
MEFNLRKKWITTLLIFVISVCLACLSDKNKVIGTNLKTLLNDSSIVYYSYDSGELSQAIVLKIDQDKAIIQKPDILIIGEILDTKEFSKAKIDTIKENWFHETDYQSYSYTVQVKSVIIGLCPKNYLEITVTSSSSYEFGFSHISENGDSVYEAFFEPLCCGHLINKRIPVGENCIFHFRKGDLNVVDYIASFSAENLDKYMYDRGLK